MRQATELDESMLQATHEHQHSHYQHGHDHGHDHDHGHHHGHHHDPHFIPLHSADRKQWQSLAELAQDAHLETHLASAHPRQAAVLQRGGMDRRTFLKVMGASLALTGVTACSTRPPEAPILPYVRKPEEVVPGIPLFFASTMTLGGFATGVVIETQEGRPTRVEGNPLHPASLGGSDPILLASILELYNPDRSTTVRQQSELSNWDALLAALQPVLETAASTGGTGLHLLTETVTSPTLTSQIQALQERFPAAVWHQYEPVGQDAVVAGAQLAFGEAVNPIYRFDQARVVVSLDADFLTSLPGSLRYARHFMDGRRVREAGTTMNRLYAVESTPTNTGAVADHRLPLRASQVESFARALANALGVDAGVAPDANWDGGWLETLVADLQANAGASLVVAGNEQPPAVHALAHAINAALGNVGNTVLYTPSIIANPVNQLEDLRALVTAMNAGEVTALVILGGNPAFTAPVDLEFAAALANVPFSVHLSMYHDETSARCQWHIPQTHYIEEWSDARAFDGTISVSQPPIGPLFPETRSAHEVLALLVGDTRPAYDLLRGYWEEQYGGDNFELDWQRTLQDGLAQGTRLALLQPTLQADLAGQLPAAAAVEGLELIFRPDPTIWDGRFAANSWLQELPKPLTKLTWDNAALVSPALAERLGLANEDVVTLSYQGRSVDAPIWVLPGHPDEAVTVTLGYGRQGGGEVGRGVGFNAYALRTADAPWFGGGLELQPTGRKYQLATTQAHFRIGGLDPVRSASLAEFIDHPDFAHASGHGPAISLLAKDEYTEDSWGMSIDLTACTGCNACVIACQSENNIPTVGKEEVLRSREMHWIRIDRYYEGELDNPTTHFQPLACVHCEKAPCEVVCPVQATVHSSDGLNQMVYNRCIGTRYCSANCPYNVRRFNWLDFIDDTPILQEMRNPNVTVRSRGVMEKCSYCVQRISRARIEAKKENRPIRDGEVLPACAAACPTRAIVFGNLNDAASEVVQLKAQPHDYGLLAELNTMPRTTYLARITNPNEALAS